MVPHKDFFLNEGVEGRENESFLEMYANMLPKVVPSAESLVASTIRAGMS